MTDLQDTGTFLSRAAKATAAMFLLVVGLVATPARADAAAAIGLSAGTFKFSTVQDRTLKGDLYVSNEGDTPIQVLIYTSDIVPNAKGVPQFVMPKRGTIPLMRSPASWTTVNAPESTRIINNAPYLVLKVGAKSHVFFQIDVPRGVPAGDYSEAIFFEMFNLGRGARGTTSKIGGRLGCRVQIRVQGKIAENVSIRPFSVGSIVFGSVLPYSFTIHNDGNIDHNFATSLQLLDSDEQVKRKVVIGKADYIYASSKKVFGGKAPVAGMGIGRYTAELRTSYLKEALEAGGRVSRTKTDIVKQRTFYVVPFYFLIPLLILLILLLLFLATIPARHRRRAKRQEPPMPGQWPAAPPPGGPGPAAPVEPPAPVAQGQWQPAPEPPPEEVRVPEPTPAPEEVVEEKAPEQPPAAPADDKPEAPKRKPRWGEVRHYGPGSSPEREDEE